MTVIDAPSLACPVPITVVDRVQLGHGSGGRMSADLIGGLFMRELGNPVLARMGDGGVVTAGATDLVVSTDSFVVSPIEFPGGDIGSLAVHGTLNDVAMMGARPICLTAGFVLEEGLPMATLERIVASMARAARDAQVPIVAGDTKVVERGKADGLYVNTTGIGLLHAHCRPGPDRARAGDAVIISGAIGRHGMTIMAAREGLDFESTITSDSACLVPLVERLAVCGASVHVLRDPTRGGVASALNEIAAASRVAIELEEDALPVPDNVRAACEMLGLDPLYVANEGVLLAIVPGKEVGRALAAIRSHALGRDAVVIGTVTDEPAATVILRTALGGARVVDLLPGDQLPRIC